MLERISRAFKRLLKQEQGATAVEYVLMAAGVAMAIAIIVFTIGDTLAELMSSLSDALNGP